MLLTNSCSLIAMIYLISEAQKLCLYVVKKNIQWD